MVLVVISGFRICESPLIAWVGFPPWSKVYQEKKADLISNLLAQIEWPCRSDNLSLVNFVFLCLYKCHLVFPREKGLESVKLYRNMLQMCIPCVLFFLAIYNGQCLCA